jgi:hypothetical protein
MVLGLNDSWRPQHSCFDGTSSFDHFSQHEKPRSQIGFSFSQWWFEGQTIGECWGASRCPEATRKMWLLRSDHRRWDMGLPQHEASDCLAFCWRRTPDPCPKHNCKWQTHADGILGIQGITHDCWLPTNSTLDWTFFCEEVLNPLALKLRPNPQKTRKPFLLIHMDNARIHMAR